LVYKIPILHAVFCLDLMFGIFTLTVVVTSVHQQIVYAATPVVITSIHNTAGLQSHTQGPCSNIDYLWTHTYDPNRLAVKQSCATVTGTVYDNPRHEPDGDTHFILSLDPKQPPLSQPNNCIPSTPKCNLLIVEIICHNSIDQVHYPKAATACSNYKSGISDPYYNEHVSVSGRSVLDTDHGSWGEIHPASDIHIIHTISATNINMTRHLTVPAGENTP
jgi:hypothetical protein